MNNRRDSQHERMIKMLNDIAKTPAERLVDDHDDAKFRAEMEHQLASIMWDIVNGRQP